MRPTIALLPSPLLGAIAWEPVAEALCATGWPAVVVDLHGGARSSDEVLEAFLSGLPRSHDLVLVPHSNAGLYAPAVAAAVRPVATVFVDAALPTTAGPTSLAPPQFYELLTGLVDEQGLLPPWTQWWGEADLDRLFPIGEWRHRVEVEEPRLPLSYFRSTVHVPAGWADNPSAYLAFGETYAVELEQARGYGWPVRVLSGGHLHILHDPPGVGSSIIELLTQLDAAHSA
jgi:hypothetical protein